MLKTYLVHWPKSELIFRVPYQQNDLINSYEQSVELVQTHPSIKNTVRALCDGIADDEWVYWCIDDKYLIAIDALAASYFSEWISKVDDPAVGGLCFCRARRLLSSSASESALTHTERGDPLLLRYNFNQIWLHQFLRVRVLREFFDGFPDTDFRAQEMEKFKERLEIPDDMKLLVTETNYAVFGESTIDGKLTNSCLTNMKKLAVQIPANFEVVDADIVIGSLGHIIGE
jgi:hypothetical protein